MILSDSNIQFQEQRNLIQLSKGHVGGLQVDNMETTFPTGKHVCLGPVSVFYKEQLSWKGNGQTNSLQSNPFTDVQEAATTRWGSVWETRPPGALLLLLLL